MPKHIYCAAEYGAIYPKMKNAKARFLLDFVESYNCGGGSKEVEDLEAQIASAAHAAEDVIESHIVDHILAGFNKKNRVSLQKIRIKLTKLLLPRVMQKVTKDMDLIKENVVGRLKARQLITCSASSRPVTVTTGKTRMVGFDDYLIRLLDKVTGQPSHQLVIPIIGMGGIGKTTLARNAFDNLLIKQHFDYCAWATISQNYSVREIMLQFLSSEEDSKKFMCLDERQLGEQLHKCLFNRRYFMVLDDIWSVEVWDEIKLFFPDNNNGSRIIVTSRLHDISPHFNSPHLAIDFLDGDKSWNLFCQESFGEEGCPAELEKVGKKICENCKGLPLSIVVIGGFLRRSSKAQEYWEGIARDTYSILNSEGDNQCMNILSLSYNHLPAHLKPCFLYMGVFAEDDEILVSQLIQLWVGEGFIRLNDAQRLEEVAEGYLKDLVDRNLVLVKRWGCNGKMRAINIHDLVRELCVSVAEKEKFFCVMKSVGTPRTTNEERRIVLHESMSNGGLRSASFVRSLISKGHMRLHFKLLRVLSVDDNVRQRGFLEADLRCVNLRCLDHRFVPAYKSSQSLHIPTQISLLWNLQTVRIEGFHEPVIAPSELWEMVQLRHLQVDRLYVPDPLRNDGVDVVLPNLQTLWNAVNFQLSEEVCKRIPNVKKLRLLYGERGCDAGSYYTYCPQNLGRFHKLESLTLRFEVLNWRHVLLSMTFPTSLKKLTLYGGGLYWKDLEMIGSLPNLEVLKLRAFSMVDSEWSPVDGGFRALKFLQIQFCIGLTKWNADHFHYPVLEKLVLGHLRDLDELPSGIGDIPTLQIISLFQCSVPCALSTVKILEEQESLGNDNLRVEVGFHINNKKDTMRFRETVEQDGFTSNNLHIKDIEYMGLAK